MNDNYMENQFRSTVTGVEAAAEEEKDVHKQNESRNSSLIDFRRKKSPLVNVFNNFEL